MKSSGGRKPVDADSWRPLLLRVPRTAVRARAEWMPVLVRGRMITTLGLLVIFLLLQFLLPARLVIGGMGAIGRPSVAVGLLLVFLWFVSAIRPHHLPSGAQPVRWIVGLFLALQLFGYVVGFDRLPSPEQASAANRWLIFVFAISGVTLAVVDGLRTRDEVDRLLRVLVGCACAMSVVGALQFFRIVDLTHYIKIPGLHLNADLIEVGARGDGNFPRVAGTAGHYIEFGVVLALVLPIAMHYALFSPQGRTRVWRWAAVGLVALGIPLSISRSAIVTVFVVMAMMAIVWPWRHRYNALVMAVLATAVFHVLNRGVLGTIKALFLNVENDTSITDRIARTARVMQLWSERPWFGWGAGMVTPEEFLLLDNQIYMFLIAGGVICVAGFLIFFTVPYMLGRTVRLRSRDQETRHLGHTLAVTMPAAVVASGTFDSFAFSTFVGTMCVLVGAVGALWRLERANVSGPPQHADPADKYVTTPLMADVRLRLRDALAAGPLLTARASGRAAPDRPPADKRGSLRDGPPQGLSRTGHHDG